ncbi:peroxiredoxin Q/BCP [Parapedobacter composti]|uniref:thioredoxin-dependent peroxiredoxin n=1 Tax=Parapedobacter composti TaxID=623281 RepID=A0A1I1JKD7_9SPHI|nr:peroxiredoxin [Parapedobacter composti]SFC49017.1 peroxiredoxin Q/BCP [Parapedobacter composti]
MMNTLGVGDKIPLFILKNQYGNDVDIADYIGKNILVIFFYPKDESPGCTKQVCAIRDSFADYAGAGALVFGINSGSVASHRSFVEKHQLPFMLLSDPGNRVLKAFGVKNVLFLTGRETFVVGLDGRIAFRYRALLNAINHNDQILNFLT